MAQSGAARQKAYLRRQKDELITLRQRVADLEDALAAAQARLAESDRLRLTRTAPQQVAYQLAEALDDTDLARLWVLLGERLRSATPRGQNRRQPETPERRQERRLARYLYPSTRRS
jgi:hypothetical protein